MIRHITAYKWSDLLQDYTPIPLDDSESWVIQLARRVNGRNLSDFQFRCVLRLLTINSTREEVRNT